MNTASMAKTALRDNFRGSADDKGYTHSPQENLVPGIDLAIVEDDLRAGGGDELRMKFRAIHSSCALAVNCFGPFKLGPGSLQLLGTKGAKRIQFEKKLPIFEGRRCPNLDVWIERENEIVAIESKMLEYFAPKEGKFALIYNKLAPPNCDPCWWKVYKETRKGQEQHLDRAQLVKHYFGLNEFRRRHPECPPLTLLYIFWEPLNWDDQNICRTHRTEVEGFAQIVCDSPIKFRWMTYNDLWEQWSTTADLATHAGHLKARYQVRL
jgi:hypothetical protein